jgi:hypothetical protein
MATTTRKRKRGIRDIKISFSNEKDQDAKPPISAAKVRQFVTEIQAIKVAEMENCEQDCGGAVRGVKALAAEFGQAVNCRYTCKWFYSEGGGWQKECYFKCAGSGLTIEGTAG